MATNAPGTRIDRGLDAILADLADLPIWVVEWDRLPEEERASLSLEWDHMMADYLPELEEFRAAHAMTAQQAECYTMLLCRLRQALPLIERLDLYRPSVTLPEDAG
jgi:hypothetical protein